jgi:hypothetical protein
MTNATMRHPPLALPWQEDAHPLEGWQRLVAAGTVVHGVGRSEPTLNETFIVSVRRTNDLNRTVPNE